MKNRVALITGASGGIGRATALALAEDGFSIAVHFNNSADRAKELVEEIAALGVRAMAFQGNLAKPEVPKQIVSDVRAHFGEVSVLINNAGVMTHFSIEEMSDEQWDESINVNLSAVFRLTRECVPAMKKNGWGRIICVSSQVAQTGSANHAHYAAAKSGLLAFTYSLAKELGSSGVTANVVLPGRITTEMIQDQSESRMDEWIAQTPMKRMGEPHEVASMLAFLASEKSSYITGAAINVNGGLVMG